MTNGVIATNADLNTMATTAVGSTITDFTPTNGYSTYSAINGKTGTTTSYNYTYNVTSGYAANQLVTEPDVTVSKTASTVTLNITITTIYSIAATEPILVTVPAGAITLNCASGNISYGSSNPDLNAGDTITADTNTYQWQYSSGDTPMLTAYNSSNYYLHITITPNGSGITPKLAILAKTTHQDIDFVIASDTTSITIRAWLSTSSF